MMNKSAKKRALLAILFGAFAMGCGDAEVLGGDDLADDRRVGKGDRGAGATADWGRDILSTALSVDLDAMRAQARIHLVASESTHASFEVGGLTIESVRDYEGALSWGVVDGALHVETRRPGSKAGIDITYTFSVQTGFDGLLSGGSTVIWPHGCGNLFPCKADPSDGLTFTLVLSGYPVGTTAIYPGSIVADVPSYTIAWAVGEYECEALGETGAGTEVSVCWLPKGKTAAREGTKQLVEVFEWLETTLGPYAYGDRVASVAVNWGEGAAGGMEHHPYWHVATDEMSDPLTHAHEAAHGWYGTGVRYACWEDFVISEGTVSYLAARALSVVSDGTLEVELWESYREELYAALEDEDIVVWPHETCGEVKLVEGELFSNLVYMKGAFFFRRVAEAVGEETLDAVLGSFYRARVGTAAGMDELLDHIHAETGFDVGPLAEHWLRSKGDPFADEQ